MAIVIIPNLAGMFNENITFFIKMTQKKGLFLALTNTDFSPRTNADFLSRIKGDGRKKLFLPASAGLGSR